MDTAAMDVEAPAPASFEASASGEEDDLDDLLMQSAKLAVRMRTRFANSGSKYYFTYVLLLQDECVYVGSTNNIVLRMLDHHHDTTMSACWVREHGPVIRVLEITRNGKPGDERYKTLEFMSMFGHESVRGDAWCKVDLRSPPSALLQFVRDRSDFEYLTRAEIDVVLKKAKSLLT